MPSTYTGSSDTGAFSADVPIGNDPRNSASVRTPMMQILDLLAGLRNRAWNGAAKWTGAHEFNLGAIFNGALTSRPPNGTTPALLMDEAPTALDLSAVYRLTAGPPAVYAREYRDASGNYWRTVNAGYDTGTGQWSADDATVASIAIEMQWWQIVYRFVPGGTTTWGAWSASSAQAPYANTAIGNAFEFSGGVRIGTGGSTGIATPTPAVNRGELWRANVPLAVAEIDAAGALVEGHNIAATSRLVQGHYEITLGTGATRLLPAVTPISINGNAVASIDSQNRTGTSFRVWILDDAAAPVATDCAFIVNVFGF